MTILIVDDNDQNLYQLRVLLEGSGYPVVTAANGAEALEKAGQHPPDLIISDILMPVMDGFALCRKWKLDESLRQIPFVFYTATYTDERDREFALGLGAAKFLVKPEEPEVFLRMVRDTLQQIQNPPATPAAPAAETPAHIAIETPEEEETGYLRQYNETLIRKLEAKMEQLEQANLELERDITYHKQVAEALQRERVFSDAVLNSLPGVVYCYDEGLRFLRWNRNFERVTGYAAGEVPHQSPLDLFAGPDRALLAARIQEVFDKGAADMEADLVSKDGTRTPYYFTGLATEIDGKPHLVGVGIDLTARKQIEGALRENEEKYRILVENAREAIFVVQQGVVQFANSMALRLAGRLEAEVVGHSILDFVQPEDRAEVVAHHQRLLSGEITESQREYRLLGRDGATAWLSVNAVRILWHGQPATLNLASDITARRRAEEDLQFRNVLLSTEQEASIDGILVVDENGRIISSNRQFADMWGIPSDILESKSDERVLQSVIDKLVIPEEFRRKVKHLYKARNETSRDEIALKDGRTFDRYSAPMFGPEKRYYGRVWYFRDMTERKQAEAALRLSHERLRRLVDSNIVGIVIADATGTVFEANEYYLRLIGYTREEFDREGVDWRAITPPEWLPADEQSIREVRERGTCMPYEKEYLRRDGTRVPVFLADATLPGPGEQIVAFVLDLSQHKQTEKQIRAQAALLDLAQDAISVRDMNGCVQYWNKSSERLTGWTAAEALGQPMFELTKAGAADIADANRMLMADGHWNGELGIVRKDGRPFTVMSRWTLVRDERGGSKSVLVINTDITEQKKMEAQFLRAQRLEGIGALASGIAHDLNNILAPVLMIAPLLRDTVLDADGRAMLTSLESSAQRGADIIKQLLTFARGKPGARVPLPVRHFLNEMNKIIHETFPRDIHARVNSSKDLWPVLGDATQLHQVLMNLCVNARDAMPDGGTLTLEAKNVTVDEAFTSVTPDARPGPYVCVSVTDTGTGIAPENLERIFDPFFTTKEIGKGTGLGLATVLGIVRGHEGFVRVDSRLGRGTTFQLYFPASPEALAADKSGQEALPPRGQGELILVVDDEAVVRDFVHRTLESQGYRVVVAAEGAEGLRVFSQHATEIRAVLTDMMMPTMHGPAMIAALRQMAPRLIILGMTGLAEQSEVKGMADLELPVVLTKPFSNGELLRELHAALQPSGGAGAKENARVKAADKS